MEIIVFYLDEKIKKVRDELKMDQDTFAKQFNTSQRAVSFWERGKSLPDIKAIDAAIELTNRKYDLEYFFSKYKIVKELDPRAGEPEEIAAELGTIESVTLYYQLQNDNLFAETGTCVIFLADNKVAITPVGLINIINSGYSGAIGLGRILHYCNALQKCELQLVTGCEHDKIQKYLNYGYYYDLKTKKMSDFGKHKTLKTLFERWKDGMHMETDKGSYL